MTNVLYLRQSVCTLRLMSGPNDSALEEEKDEMSQSEAGAAEVGYIWNSAHITGNYGWI